MASVIRMMNSSSNWSVNPGCPGVTVVSGDECPYFPGETVYQQTLNDGVCATFDAALNGDMAWGGWHNVVLTAGELHEAMWRGMTLRGLIDHRPMWTTTEIADLSGSANAGTTSGSVATVAAAPPRRSPVGPDGE